MLIVKSSRDPTKKAPFMASLSRTMAINVLRILEFRKFEEPLGIVAHQLVEAGEIGQNLFLIRL